MWLWRGWLARPDQLQPSGDWWDIWLVLAGRGYGKTRTGAEWVYENIDRYSMFVIAGRTAAETRDVLIEGPSGILNVGPPDQRPVYSPSRRRIEWPNGSIAIVRSGEEPDSFRGLNVQSFWFDEFASWKKPQDAWDAFIFGFRSGDQPRGIVTTTPKPIPQLKEWIAEAKTETGTIAITRGRTIDNIGNLARTFIRNVVRRYAGTRLGRQELDAELLEDTVGALWTLKDIERLRLDPERDADRIPPFLRIVIGVDPEASSEEESAETGIICCALGANGHGYVLHDVSIRGTPKTWGHNVVNLYLWKKADRVVGEVNNGGDMVGHVIHTIRINDEPVGENVSFKAVHATHGKVTRAEPISALYEQDRIHHVGVFPELENQMTQWVPGMTSPDRMDALVWAFTELMGDNAYTGWTAWAHEDRQKLQAGAAGEAVEVKQGEVEIVPT